MRPPLISYYGDDLTGSTDVMEALSLGGVPTVLFLRVPNAPLLARFADRRAIGLAGTSRSETPEWMEENLAPAFKWLRSLGAAVCHYKVCSTFDSGPGVGSIGRAVEIGRRVFAQRTVPLVVGAPQLKRYTAFGNLFAAYRGTVYRIDRHPVMSRHPVTPMYEADLLAHLSHQTSLRSALIDLAALRAPDVSARVDAAAGEAEMVLLDVADTETQELAGRELWRRAREHGAFVMGSSGVEYALLPEWEKEGLAAGPTEFPPLASVDQLAVVSGSVSPTTEAQIRFARNAGFETVAVDPIHLSGDDALGTIENAVRAGMDALGAGRSVVLHTALGPDGDRGAEIDQDVGARHRLGCGLGDILKRLVVGANLRRAVIAGGDTSSHALRQLGVDALTVRMPLPQTPGSPLCVAHAESSRIDGLEIALKGGQIGLDDYFLKIRDGDRHAPT
ncbi:four-carbon acid sugar kinase family protein [Mesorhizobium sp. LHD-90]|uniref:four-carbon acid sugar kinase family protein n=1 Tax=Mesorhizobium sp. LHD-90 TaxID=3071414 RepID=UPI0027DF001F|nr:four-carbon acid sugar kinase family protein [Mesorhizobium sp. LHD-90]MDQ6433949.1 four-carbon acid sugar kinase family protein [Mesorhizobium sp. LHD-90]